MIDNDQLKRRFKNNHATQSDRHSVNYQLLLTGIRYLYQDTARIPMFVAKLPLKLCGYLLGTQDDARFHRNIRSSFATREAVSNSIRGAVVGRKGADFFYFGFEITALCRKMHLEGEVLSLWDLNIVSGSYLLSTFFARGEEIKNVPKVFILVRIHEIPNRKSRDRIAMCASWQTVLTPRDRQRCRSARLRN